MDYVSNKALKILCTYNEMTESTGSEKERVNSFETCLHQRRSASLFSKSVAARNDRVRKAYAVPLSAFTTI